MPISFNKKIDKKKLEIKFERIEVWTKERLRQEIIEAELRLERLKAIKAANDSA